MAKKKVKKMVVSTWLNLREEPNGKIIDVIKAGLAVNVSKVDGDWASVEVEETGKKGFVMAAYLKEGV